MKNLNNLKIEERVALVEEMIGVEFSNENVGEFIGMATQYYEMLLHNGQDEKAAFIWNTIFDLFDDEGKEEIKNAMIKEAKDNIKDVRQVMDLGKEFGLEVLHGYDEKIYELVGNKDNETIENKKAVLKIREEIIDFIQNIDTDNLEEKQIGQCTFKLRMRNCENEFAIDIIKDNKTYKNVYVGKTLEELQEKVNKGKKAYYVANQCLEVKENKNAYTVLELDELVEEKPVAPKKETKGGNGLGILIGIAAIALIGLFLF